MSYHQRQSSDSQNHQARHSSVHSARRGPSTQAHRGSSDRQRGPRTDESSSSGGLFSRVTGGIASFIGGRASETETSEGCDCDALQPGSREHSSSSTITRDRHISEGAPRSARLKELQTPDSSPAPPLSQADAVSQNDNLSSNPALARKKIKDPRERSGKSDEQRERLPEQIQHQERHYESRLERMEKELEGRQATIRHLEQEIHHLHRNETSLKVQLSSRQSPMSLDPFYNQVDQISEAQIIRDGNPSLNSINDAIDNFVTELLEEVGSLGHSQRTGPPSQGLHRFNPLLLVLLQGRLITEEKAGYIVDAALHNFLVTILVEAFFKRAVTHCPNAEHCLSNIDSLYHGLALQENWSVSQRWRSLTVTHIAESCSPACCDAIQAQAESEIITFLSWAFTIPTSSLDGLRAKLNDELWTIIWDAHQLSAIIKRDFLSARLTVTAAPFDHNANQYLALDSDRAVSVWPKMGARHGDEVIGSYKLGLDSLTEKGHVKHLVKAEVITITLSRMVQQ